MEGEERTRARLLLSERFDEADGTRVISPERGRGAPPFALSSTTSGAPGVAASSVTNTGSGDPPESASPGSFKTTSSADTDRELFDSPSWEGAAKVALPERRERGSRVTGVGRALSSIFS